MNIREMMNNNPAVVTIGAVVVLVLCLGAIMCQLRGPSRPSGPIDLYFFDTNAGTLFTASSDQYPPIPAPSDTGTGTSGVRAHVFGCGGCPGDLDGMTPGEVEDAGAFIGYLERYTEEAKAALEQSRGSDHIDSAMMYEMNLDTEVREVGSDQWVSGMDARGTDVYDRVRERCEGQERAEACRPGG